MFELYYFTDEHLGNNACINHGRVLL